MLTNEQENLVNIAISQMSDADIARIRSRTAKVRVSEDDNVSSISQDTMEPIHKGKAIDPRNWGNIEFDESEMNLGIQQAMLKHYNTTRDAEHFVDTMSELPKDKPHTTRQTAGVEEVEDEDEPRMEKSIAKIGHSRRATLRMGIRQQKLGIQCSPNLQSILRLEVISIVHSVEHLQRESIPDIPQTTKIYLQNWILPLKLIMALEGVRIDILS
ncbi:hypothetical protein F5890DRAFT_1478946 [Lentinula detonsa]|uniref:Uncharacterized protein n=1 Tax=Lentinula detonsa TaxID=2804962 RepID=A0AA38PNP4_9AGAR|nr:hypothetical protein F5890DRAFT_1478946 [Lentinula detonsa]